MTVTANVPCNATVSYKIIGGGGGGGNGTSAFTGGDATMITGTFKLNSCCTSGTTAITIIAAGGGGGGLRGVTLPSPNFATGGGGYGKGGNSGNVNLSPAYNSTSAAFDRNYRYGGGGGGGSAILLGTSPILVAGGGGGGGVAGQSDNITNGGSLAGITYDNAVGGDAAPGAAPNPDGFQSRITITSPSTDSPNIVGEQVLQPPGKGAVGATPGAGAAAGTTNYFGGSVVDNDGTGTYFAPANVMLAGASGTGPGTGNGGTGVQANSVWPANAGSQRGVYMSIGSPGGGGGYAGGGSSGLTIGSSGSKINLAANPGSVRRMTSGVCGGAGAGSYFIGGTVGCVTVLTNSGPKVSDMASYGFGGAGNGGAGLPGYVLLTWA